MKANKLTLQLGSRNKAKVAIANKIAKIIFMMLNDSLLTYKDPGIPKVKTPEKQIKNLLGKLKKLGVSVQYYTNKKIVAKSELQISI